MANAQGVKRQLSIAKETTFGVKAAAGSGKILTRTESTVNTAFDAFQSEELRDDMQQAASVIGFEKVEGDIKGELACGQWAQFFAAALRGNWGEQAKKPIITKTADGAGEKSGKILSVPKTQHTTDAFTIEDVFKDINLTRVYTGCRVAKMSLDVQPNGIASVTVTFLGKAGEERNETYFTNPSAQMQSDKLAGVNGKLLLNKRQAALVTAFKLDIDLNASSEAVLGERTAPDVFIGTVKVSGSLTMYFQDRTMIDAVRNGTSLSLALRLDADTSANSDYLTLILPGVKMNSLEIDDGAKLLMITSDFTAFPAVYDAQSKIDDQLKQATTMIVQDTLA